MARGLTIRRKHGESIVLFVDGKVIGSIRCTSKNASLEFDFAESVRIKREESMSLKEREAKREAND